MWRRALITFASLIALVVVGIPAWVAIHSRDLPEVDDADLLLDVAPVAPEDDAYVGFQRASDAMVWEGSEESRERLFSILTGEVSDPDWIEANVRANEQAFELLERALDAPHIVIPPFVLDHYVEPMSLYVSLQTLVRLATIDARQHLRDGDQDRALERALLGLRVAKKLSEARAPHLVALMTAVAMQSVSLRELERMAPSLALSFADSQNVVALLGALRWEPDAWRRSWASEYRFFEQVLATLSADEPEVSDWHHDGTTGVVLRHLPADYSFQVNRTLALAAEMYRELGEGSQRSCREAWAEGSRPSEWTALHILLTPNASGRILLEIARPNLEAFDRRRCGVETRLALVQTIFALDAYRREHGALPETLDALVPEFLEAVPRDRFDGEPLRWVREQGVLYSIGEDLIDRGPPPQPSLENMAVPAVRIPPTAS